MDRWRSTKIHTCYSLDPRLQNGCIDSNLVLHVRWGANFSVSYWCQHRLLTPRKLTLEYGARAWTAYTYQEDPILHWQCWSRLCLWRGSSWVWVRRTATTGTWESTSARRTGTTRCRWDTAVRTCLVETIDMYRRKIRVRSVLCSCQIRSPCLRGHYKHKKKRSELLKRLHCIKYPHIWVSHILTEPVRYTFVCENWRNKPGPTLQTRHKR